MRSILWYDICRSYILATLTATQFAVQSQRSLRRVYGEFPQSRAA